MGCQSIAGLPPALNLPVPIYTPGWRGNVRVKCLANNSTQGGGELLIAFKYGYENQTAILKVVLVIKSEEILRCRKLFLQYLQTRGLDF